MDTKVKVAGQPVTTLLITLLTSEPQQAPTAPKTQPSVALTTPKQAAAQSLQQYPTPSG